MTQESPTSTTPTSSIRIALRVRPLSRREEGQGDEHLINLLPKFDNIVQLPDQRTFAYDYVFTPETEQMQLYTTAVAPLAESFITGYNATILAYVSFTCSSALSGINVCAYRFNFPCTCMSLGPNRYVLSCLRVAWTLTCILGSGKTYTMGTTHTPNMAESQLGNSSRQTEQCHSSNL
jgi:hypothetical protein